MKLKSVDTTSGQQYINFEHIVRIITMVNLEPGAPDQTRIMLSDGMDVYVNGRAEDFIHKYKISVLHDL